MLRALFKPSSRVLSSILHPRTLSNMSSAGGNKLFVGNLAWTTDSERLRSSFSEFGDVLDAIVMLDRETGRSRGFGFITFQDQAQADAAIEALNGQPVDGREIRVNYANTQTGGGGGGQRQGGGGYRGGGGGGGGYNSSYSGGGYGGDQGGHGGGGYGGNSGQQSYGGGQGGAYGGGGQGQGQGNWRGGQQDSYNSQGGGGGGGW